MNEHVFLGGTAILLAFLVFWGFRYLPGERWQMMAVVPMRKRDSDHWSGTNLTYYGFFIATSQLFSLVLLLILLGAMNISLSGTVLTTSILLAICVPAARIVARIVEKKHHTFTVGGASFVGILLAPVSIFFSEKLINLYTDCDLPMMPVLAAMAIAYSLGEGLGRLACISYGCCYGKPLSECGPITRMLFKKTGTIFFGPNKKVEYESHLSGERLVPIQAITCLIYTCTALTGSWLFLHGQFTAGFLLAMSVTQIWRFFSETLRADFRGFGEISVYQKMGGIAVLYSCCIAMINRPGLPVQPDILEGIVKLWNPGIIVGLQVAWIVFFVYFGRSTVTSSTVSFTLLEDRI